MNTEIKTEDLPTPVKRLKRDLIRQQMLGMTTSQARYIVDLYYSAQGERIALGNQIAAMSKTNEPHMMLDWINMSMETIEDTIKVALDEFTNAHPMGAWMRGIYGIGPVISGGLLAHLDINKAPTVGHFWRFAGLDPSMKWEKGQKRPYNARLKQICWHASECFKRFSGRDECYYGQLYKQRKQYEIDRNERGGNAEVAATTLARWKAGDDAATTAVLKEGKLPPGLIDRRACRWAVKLFLAHLHDEWYRQEFKKEPPLPYPIAHMGHAHVIKGPTAS